MLCDNAPPKNPPGHMAGFDDEFSDIVDYILRITYRIWEGKQVGLCHRYYTENCPVYTLAGYTEGAEQVTQNTLATLGAFPDRTLRADNIIWSGDAESGFHTSHLITTEMTHLGDSEHGPATGKRAKFQVIAHCVVKENKIAEEWLVRDNWTLAQQLGADPLMLAKQAASQPLDPESTHSRWLIHEWRRVQESSREAFLNLAEEPGERLSQGLHNIWNARLVGDCRAVYHEDAIFNPSASDPITGIDAVESWFLSILAALPDAKISLDHTCGFSMLKGEYLSIRWTIAGTHLGGSLWGAASGAEVLILGESHYRLENGKIAEEWLVFDQIAVLTQIERARRKFAGRDG